MTRRRRNAFVALAVLLGLCLGALVAEFGLRARRAWIQASEVMDPGLLRYDPRLGWRLTPGWRGRHRHADFDVGYVVNAEGFRGPLPGAKTLRRIALVGDSFTFGLGVEQEQTFACLLAAEGWEVLNVGIPGYSTDQEVLHGETRVLALAPDDVVLVVCLINDLLDNLRPFPLQAPYRKPYFVRAGSEWTLTGAPVPRERKSDEVFQDDLAALVFPEDRSSGGLVGWLGRRELFQLLGLFQAAEPSSAAGLEERFEEPLDLFAYLVRRLASECAAHGARLHVALLPGRSYVARPTGWSATYQEHLRAAIVADAPALGVPVIDLARPLREAGEDLFLPNEGHLDAQGHRAVARHLAAALR